MVKVRYLQRVGVFESLADFLQSSEEFQEIFCDLYKISKEQLKELLEKGDLIDWVDENIGKCDTEVIEEILDVIEDREPCVFYYTLYNEESDSILIEKWEIVPEEAIRDISEKILVANWYEKENVEYWLGEEITDEEYLQLVNRWNKYGLWDEINEIVSEFIQREYEEIRQK